MNQYRLEKNRISFFYLFCHDGSKLKISNKRSSLNQNMKSNDKHTYTYEILFKAVRKSGREYHTDKSFSIKYI
jgi:hypothetical protein